MTTTYLCGLCPLGQEYRDENETEVRKHITQSDDPRHRGRNGNDRDVIIYRAGEERDSISLTMSLAEAASSNDDEKRTIAAALEYPYLSLRAIRRIADVSEFTTDNLLDNHPRVALERERRKLDYVRDDTRYKQRPDGTPKQPTIDPTERSILEYAFEHPEGTVAEVKEELDLDLSTTDIRDIVQEKTICPHLPRTADQRDALVLGHTHPDWTASEVADELGVTRTVAEEALYRNFNDEEWEAGDSQKEGFPETYLKVERVAKMKLEPEEYMEDAHDLGFPVKKPDERPIMHRHKDTLLYLYYYGKRTLDEAGNICGVSGQSMRTWLEKHDIHKKYSDYTFDIEDLYHGHDELNNREYAHLIPSARDTGEEPDRVVIEAPNVRYEGPSKGIDTTTGRAPQTFSERPRTPGRLSKDSDKEDVLAFLDHEKVMDYQLPMDLHDTDKFISANAKAGNVAVGAVIQLPTDTELRSGPLQKAIAEISDMKRSSIAERMWALADEGYISHTGSGPRTFYSITADQKAILRGEEPEDEEPVPESTRADFPVDDPHAPSPTDTSAHSTAPTTTEKVGITPPQPTATAEEVRAEQEQAAKMEIIAGQHPDDVLTDEEYVTLVRLVARDESALTDHDVLLKKLMRLGGVALMDDE